MTKLKVMKCRIFGDETDQIFASYVVGSGDPDNFYQGSFELSFPVEISKDKDWSGSGDAWAEAWKEQSSIFLEMLLNTVNENLALFLLSTDPDIRLIATELKKGLQKLK